MRKYRQHIFLCILLAVLFLSISGVYKQVVLYDNLNRMTEYVSKKPVYKIQYIIKDTKNALSNYEKIESLYPIDTITNAHSLFSGDIETDATNDQDFNRVFITKGFLKYTGLENVFTPTDFEKTNPKPILIDKRYRKDYPIGKTFQTNSRHTYQVKGYVKGSTRYAWPGDVGLTFLLNDSILIPVTPKQMHSYDAIDQANFIAYSLISEKDAPLVQKRIDTLRKKGIDNFMLENITKAYQKERQEVKPLVFGPVIILVLIVIGLITFLIRSRKELIRISALDLCVIGLISLIPSFYATANGFFIAMDHTPLYINLILCIGVLGTIGTFRYQKVRNKSI